MTNFRDRVHQAGLGIQRQVVITAPPSLAVDQCLGKALTECGVIDKPGDYYCDIDTQGIGSLEIDLTPSGATGASIVPSIYATYSNDVAPKFNSTPVGQAFVGGVARVYTFTLKGEATVRLKFTVAPGDTLTFDPGADPAVPTALAEVNGR